MPAVETHMPPKPDRPRVNRATLDTTTALMAEQFDDLREGVLTEVRGMRQDFRMFIRALLGLFAVGGLITLIGGGGMVYYTLSLFGELRGVDTSRAASSSATVITATADAVTTTTSALNGNESTSTTTTTTTPAIEPTAEPE